MAHVAQPPQLCSALQAYQWVKARPWDIERVPMEHRSHDVCRLALIHDLALLRHVPATLLDNEDLLIAGVEAYKKREAHRPARLVNLSISKLLCSAGSRINRHFKLSTLVLQSFFGGCEDPLTVLSRVKRERITHEVKLKLNIL